MLHVNFICKVKIHPLIYSKQNALSLKSTEYLLNISQPPNDRAKD